MLTASTPIMPDPAPLAPAVDPPSAATTFTVTTYDWMHGYRVVSGPTTVDSLAEAVALARVRAAYHTNNEAVVATADGERVGTVKFGIWQTSGGRR